MKYCQKCGKEMLDEAVVCPSCGCMAAASARFAAEEDSISVGLCVLSALIPLFGVIYWAVKHSATPKRAKACGVTALVAWGAGLILTCLFSSVLYGTLFALL